MSLVGLKLYISNLSTQVGLRAVRLRHELGMAEAAAAYRCPASTCSLTFCPPSIDRSTPCHGPPADDGRGAGGPLQAGGWGHRVVPGRQGPQHQRLQGVRVVRACVCRRGIRWFDWMSITLAWCVDRSRPNAHQLNRYGFVTFKKTEDGERALKELNGSVLDGR